MIKKLFFCAIIVIFVHQLMMYMFKKNPLMQYAGLPITGADIKTCFPDLAAPAKKIQALEQRGEIIRLKRNLFIVNSELTG